MTFQYQGKTSGRGPSPAIFDVFDRDTPYDFNEGIRTSHDFTSWGGTVTSNVGTYASDGGGVKSYESTSSTLRGKNSINSVTEPGGILCFSADATADHVVAIETGDLQALAPFKPVNNSGVRLGFECRVLFEQITTQSFFCGLTVPNKAGATGIFTTGDALQAISLFGFWVLAAAGSTLKFGYGLSSAAITTIATAQTLVANTWYKFGFLLTPMNGSNLLQCFVNGVEVLSCQKTNVAADANFPTSVAMLPNVTAKTSHAGTPAVLVDLDWVHCYQDAP